MNLRTTEKNQEKIGFVSHRFDVCGLDWFATAAKRDRGPYNVNAEGISTIEATQSLGA
jgi:hypothetical protein